MLRILGMATARAGQFRWLLPGMAALGLFAYLLTLVEAQHAGRAYAAYGGVYITAALGWLWMIEGAKPDRWDLIGAAICPGRCWGNSIWASRRIAAATCRFFPAPEAPLRRPPPPSLSTGNHGARKGRRAGNTLERTRRLQRWRAMR